MKMCYFVVIVELIHNMTLLRIIISTELTYSIPSVLLVKDKIIATVFHFRETLE